MGLQAERILTNISLFSGVGGLDLAAKWTKKIKTVLYCEYEKYAQENIKSRIFDGELDDAPIWDDVSTLDGRSWKGVDIVSGGFPCQDVSNAGRKAGIEKNTRSGLFYELVRICREVGPRFILLENVSGLLVYPGAHRVFGELADLGYDAGWKIISTSDVNGPIERKRIWIIAFPRGVARFNSSGIVENRYGENEGWGSSEWGANRIINEMGPMRELSPSQLQTISGCSEPPLLRMDDGVVERLDEIKNRLRCCGNGVVPQQALPAWEELILLDGFEMNRIV